MIVLVIMAAATAVVWPNLQRPLNRTPLAESASQIRELLDDARNQASNRGSAHFVRLELGSNRVYFGTFQQFLGDGSLTTKANSLSGDSKLSLTSGPTLPPQFRELSENVVVSNVRNRIDRGRPSSTDSNSDNFDGSTVGGIVADSPVTAAELPVEPFSKGIKTEGGHLHWLPMLSGELGRDATITLFDSQQQDSIEITYCAATGAIEILP